MPGLRCSLAAMLAALLIPVAAFAQHAQTLPDRAEHKRGAPERPAHQPHPELKPAEAMQHLHLAYTAAQAARDNGTPPPAPRPRPAGAGRYVAAVITCPDADLDVPTLLGVARADILWISTPGPFTSTETVALIEHLATTERLSLVVLLGHDECSTRSLGERTAAQRSLSNRLAVLRHNTGLQAAATRGFLLAQREALLASSDDLRALASKDALRVVPGCVDRNGTLSWLGQRIDAMPMQPVK